MSHAFANVNELWGAVLAGALARLGLSDAVVSPGSRSTPLACALAGEAGVIAIPVLDERSASFFALGLARRTHRPVALVCTSGTAAANYFPAVVEARESGVPLLLLTADRPPELRHCQSGQTIDQLKLYGSYPNFQAELSLPSPEPGRLRHLRQTLAHAWEKALHPAGPVHLNVPFRDPLAPVAPPGGEGGDPPTACRFDIRSFLDPIAPPPRRRTILDTADAGRFAEDLRGTARGIIVAGNAGPEKPQAYCEAVASISNALGWPVLADGLGPLRNRRSLNPNLITTYDAILRNPEAAARLAPGAVLSLGPLPTSKVLRAWLEAAPAKTWVAAERPDNVDALHRASTRIHLDPRGIAAVLDGGESRSPVHAPDTGAAKRAWLDPAAESNGPAERAWLHTGSTYQRAWLDLDRQMEKLLEEGLAAAPDAFEGAFCPALAHHLPEGAPLTVANSMPVRDVEYFWPKNDRRIEVYVNRGANGIDGTLSTALGVAHRAGRPAALLTGDLAFLHDTNGLLAAAELDGHLTVVVVNNNGGGIFEALPISGLDPPFERFFATPQTVSIEQLAAAYGARYERAGGAADLARLVAAPPADGLRIIEVATDRKADMARRKTLFRDAAMALALDQLRAVDPPPR